MAGTISQYQQGAFSTPVNGTVADATVVLSNDNATRTKHNSHDSDATIHVQSSTLASRPAASVAQRVWITTDGLRAYIDTGVAWNEVAYLSLAAGGTVSGPVVLSSTLAVSGATTFNGGATVASGQTLTLTGATVAGAPTWSSGQTFPTAVTIGANATNNGHIILNSIASAAGSAYVECQDAGTAIWRIGRGVTTGTRIFQLWNGALSSTALTIDDTTNVASFSAGVDLTGTPPAAAASHVAFGGSTRTTIGANGAATALTAAPLGYLDINVGGTIAQIPYYNRGA